MLTLRPIVSWNLEEFGQGFHTETVLTDLNSWMELKSKIKNYNISRLFWESIIISSCSHIPIPINRVVCDSKVEDSIKLPLGIISWKEIFLVGLRI